jgi:hypothetical protein
VGAEIPKPTRIGPLEVTKILCWRNLSLERLYKGGNVELGFLRFDGHFSVYEGECFYNAESPPPEVLIIVSSNGQFITPINQVNLLCENSRSSIRADIIQTLESVKWKYSLLITAVLLLAFSPSIV